MNKLILEAIPEIVIQLGNKKRVDISAFLGFDASIDHITKVVKDKKENNDIGFYANSTQLGEFLINLSNKSCSLELQTKLSKIGGNMVITGNALGNLGIRSDCVGTFGFPEILSEFRSMSENCTLHTVGDTISATALEFNDSKVILFDPRNYDELNWNRIKDIIGIERLKKLFSGKQLISLLNWSEIENSSLIWKGILEEILPSLAPVNVPPYFFTDFSDCSRKSKKEIQFAIALLSGFKKYCKVIISLNQKEAALIAKALKLPTRTPDEEFIKSIFIATHADIVIIHRVKDALAYDGNTYERCETFFCKEPTILTGGGDNFNAGFCYSLFHQVDLFQSLIIANAVSGYYVQTGESPTVDNLLDFLNKK